MPDCPNTPKCIFFNDQMANMPTNSGVMKKIYCQDNYVEGTRYMVCVKFGGPVVPSDLYSPMVDGALAQIAEAGI